MSGTLEQLARLFASLSLLAIGGINAVVPEMQRQAVNVHRWMSAARFAELYALAQAAPGPNFLVATLVGLQVAGVLGALTTTFALIAPTCLLTYAVSTLWHRLRASGWRQVAQVGLTPVTVGLVLSAAALIASAAAAGTSGTVLELAVAFATVASRLHPLWLLGAGAALGAAGLV